MCFHPDQRNPEKIFHASRNHPKPIQKLLVHFLTFCPVLNSCYTLINIQLLYFIYDIRGRNKSIHIQIHQGIEVLHSGGYSLQIFYRFIQHFTVQIIAHCFHVPMLPFSQQISCSTNLQIPHGNFEAASQFRKFPNGLESFFRYFFQYFIPFIHKKGISHPAASSYPSPKLVKLGKSHLVGIINNHGIYVGNIHTGFNNGGGNQYINFSINKIIHDFFQLLLLHLSMCKGHICLRHQLLYGHGYICNGIYPVIDIVYLSPSGQLPNDGLPYHFLIVFTDIGLDGQTFTRRLFQNAHVPDSYQTHMEGSGNGCSRQRKHIHILFHLLDFFLMPYTKPLLLIHNQKPQILEFQIFG